MALSASLLLGQELYHRTPHELHRYSWTIVIYIEIVDGNVESNHIKTIYSDNFI